MSRWSQSGKKSVSYVKEMLKHQYSWYGLLGSVAAGTMLSIPFGLGPALLPVVGYLASTSLAALFVPGSRKFRDKVDRKTREKERETTRTHLIQEITKRVGPDHQFWEMYARLLDRTGALRRVSVERGGAVGQDDIDRLDDATVDFLGLWLGRIAISERDRMFSEDELKSRVANLEKDLESVNEPADKRRIQKAITDLKQLVKRRQEMKSRDAAAEASMLAMADTFDEVYQRVMANPTSNEAVATELRSAVDRMNVEEELDHVLFDEVEAMLQSPPQSTEAPR